MNKQLQERLVVCGKMLNATPDKKLSRPKCATHIPNTKTSVSILRGKISTRKDGKPVMNPLKSAKRNVPNNPYAVLLNGTKRPIPVS